MAIIPHTGGKGNPNETPVQTAVSSGIRPFWLSDGVLTVAAVLLSGSAGFGLGYLSGQEGSMGEKGYSITQSELPAALSTAASLTGSAAAPKSSSYVPPVKVEKKGTATAETGKYVASKSGAKYHLPTCSGAKAMKEENKIWFNTKEEAETAGYAPAANCKGI